MPISCRHDFVQIAFDFLRHALRGTIQRTPVTVCETFEDRRQGVHRLCPSRSFVWHATGPSRRRDNSLLYAFTHSFTADAHFLVFFLHALHFSFPKMCHSCNPWRCLETVYDTLACTISGACMCVLSNNRVRFVCSLPLILEQRRI